MWVFLVTTAGEPAGLKQAATSRAAPPVPQKDGFMVAREFKFIRIRLVYYYDPCKNEGFQNMLMVRSFTFWRLAGVQDLISVGILAFWPPVLSRANGSEIDMCRHDTVWF